MTDVNTLVADNARRFRLERGLSLGDLARRSGLSKQTLSKLEQGQGNPTVDTLAALATALEVSLRGLLTQWGTQVFMQRHDDAVWTDAPAWSERLLDEVYGSGYVRTLTLRLARDAAPVTVPGHQAGTLHHLYVVTGRMRTGPVTDPVELGAGDFVRFPGDVDHRHVCLTDKVLVHLVTTLPQVRQFGPRSRVRATTTTEEEDQS